LEKIPFLGLAIIFCIITFWVQNKEGSTYFGNTLPLIMRFANVLISYMTYLEKMFWPMNLAVFYPYKLSLPLWQILFSAIIVSTISIAVIYYIKRAPFIFVGWFWYLGTLVPVVGLVQVGEQAMADRYTYLPSIGIGIILSWGMSLLFKRYNSYKKYYSLLQYHSWSSCRFYRGNKCGYWKNSITIFNHVLEVTDGNYLAHNNLGHALMEKGEINKAIGHFDKAVKAKRNYAKAYYNRGNAYAKLGQHQRAIEEYNEAIRQKPGFGDVYNKRGFSRSQLGQYALAIEDFNNAIRIMPDSSEAYYNLGVILRKVWPTSTF